MLIRMLLLRVLRSIIGFIVTVSLLVFFPWTITRRKILSGMITYATFLIGWGVVQGLLATNVVALTGSLSGSETYLGVLDLIFFHLFLIIGLLNGWLTLGAPSLPGLIVLLLGLAILGVVLSQYHDQERQPNRGAGPTQARSRNSDSILSMQSRWLDDVLSVGGFGSDSKTVAPDTRAPDTDTDTGSGPSPSLTQKIVQALSPSSTSAADAQGRADAGSAAASHDATSDVWDSPSTDPDASTSETGGNGGGSTGGGSLFDSDTPGSSPGPDSSRGATPGPGAASSPDSVTPTDTGAESPPGDSPSGSDSTSDSRPSDSIPGPGAGSTPDPVTPNDTETGSPPGEPGESDSTSDSDSR